jgi:hypothetical protein
MSRNVVKTVPPLPWTPRVAAEQWGISPARVRKLVSENRVKHTKVGGGPSRAGAILIQQMERPEPKVPAPRRKTS